MQFPCGLRCHSRLHVPKSMLSHRPVDWPFAKFELQLSALATMNLPVADCSYAAFPVRTFLYRFTVSDLEAPSQPACQVCAPINRQDKAR